MRIVRKAGVWFGYSSTAKDDGRSGVAECPLFEGSLSPALSLSLYERRERGGLSSGSEWWWAGKIPLRESSPDRFVVSRFDRRRQRQRQIRSEQIAVRHLPCSKKSNSPSIRPSAIRT